MASEFKKTLEEALGAIDTEQDRIARIQQIQAQIAELDQQGMELKQQMQHEMEALVGDLAVGVRNRMPGVAVNLNGGRCSVNHLSNNLSLAPDITSGTWNIDGNKSGRRFRKHHANVLDLKSDVGPLADSIGHFFKRRYKRLNTENAIQHKGVSKTQASGYYA